MSTTVLAELLAQPGRGDDVAGLLLRILGESLEHEGCEIIRIIRDQDDPDHVAGLTQWTERHHYDDYLAWRSEHGVLVSTLFASRPPQKSASLRNSLQE